MKPTVHDVAAYILLRQGPMTTMKLQKLVYYSAAVYLARHGVALFAEPIQAWTDGPAVWELYCEHRGEREVAELPKGDPRHLNAEQLRAIIFACRMYGAATGEMLRELTHQEKPWLEAREGLRPSAISVREIAPQTMADYYRRNIPFVTYGDAEFGEWRWKLIEQMSRGFR